MSLVECVATDGRKKLIRQEDLRLRPAVYGIIINGDKVLLMRLLHTGKYHPPGGGIGLGERVEDALRREIREETGIEVEVEVEGFARFAELFFYYDPSETAYHGLHFYYVCRPQTLELLDDALVEDDAAGKPRWVEIAGLQAQDFQAHGDVILELCQASQAQR